ncbi:hypothetical protein TgHK011_000830 [Trichoderma gracile]|nr:hypothetical protein TgHK011_000830 [Trichoderma gracile]
MLLLAVPALDKVMYSLTADGCRYDSASHNVPAEGAKYRYFVDLTRLWLARHSFVPQPRPPWSDSSIHMSADARIRRGDHNMALETRRSWVGSSAAQYTDGPETKRGDDETHEKRARQSA